MISLPVLSYGQSTLSFPRVIQQGEFTTTGLALVNPESTSAIIRFTLYGADGNPGGTVEQTIPARGQLARLARELFPTATGAGWVQVTSTNTGLQGFWFAGDLATYADGAEAAPSSTELVLPIISPQSEIHIANTGASEVTVLLDLLGADGYYLADPYPQLLPAKGYLRMDMVSLFPTLNDLSLPSHMRVTCKCANASPVAATVIARNVAAPSWTVSNGVPAASTATTIYFPHLVEGPQINANWQSAIGLTNLSTTSPNDVFLTFTSESGGIVRTNQITLPPNGGARFTARDLFALSSGFENGWVSAASRSGLPLTGYIAYANLAAAGVAVVPAQTDSQTKLLFAHIADLPPWLTGLALLNTNPTPANVDLFAMTPSGSLIGSTSLSLQAGANTARLLRELIPLTQNRASDGGFVFIQSSLPIYGIELFFSRNLGILANVSAGSGNMFVPPLR
jgi:hypothetical protein